MVEEIAVVLLEYRQCLLEKILSFLMISTALGCLFGGQCTTTAKLLLRSLLVATNISRTLMELNDNPALLPHFLTAFLILLFYKNEMTHGREILRNGRNQGRESH